MPVLSRFWMSATDQSPIPVVTSDVMLGAFWPSGPPTLPENAMACFIAPSALRGVWHSPQWPTAWTR